MVDRPDRAGRRVLQRRWVSRDHPIFVADQAAGDGERLLIEFEMIDFTFPRDHRFAQPIVGIDHDLSEIARHGMDRKTNPRDLAGNLTLDNDRHCARGLGKALMMAIQDGPIGPEGDETIADRRYDGVRAANV